MTDLTHIPVIDIGRLDDDAGALQQVHEACCDWGFFQIVGHGVSADLRNATHAAMHAFFQLPIGAKRLASECSAPSPAACRCRRAISTRPSGSATAASCASTITRSAARRLHRTRRWAGQVTSASITTPIPARSRSCCRTTNPASRFTAATRGRSSNRIPMRASSISATSCRSGRTIVMRRRLLSGHVF